MAINYNYDNLQFIKKETLDSMADAIRDIKPGAGTMTATEMVEEVAALNPNSGGTITPGTEDLQVAATGDCMTGNIVVKGDEALQPQNIVEWANIFGVQGTYKGGADTPATAETTDIRENETAWVNGAKITGVVPTRTADNVSIDLTNNITEHTNSVSVTAAANVTIDTTSNADEVIITGMAAATAQASATARASATADTSVENGIYDTTVTKTPTASDTNTATADGSDSHSVTATITKTAGLTVVPGHDTQTFEVKDKYITGNVVVSGDDDLHESNIKAGTEIFGVTGTYAPPGNFSSTGLTANYSSGDTSSFISGNVSITGNKNYPKETTVGMLVGSVSTIGKYAHELDGNLEAGNIADGVTIFGVTGTYDNAPPEGTVTKSGPHTVSVANKSDLIRSTVKIEPKDNSGADFVGVATQTVTTEAHAADLDIDLIPRNIKNGVTLFGVKGTYDNRPPDGTLTISEPTRTDMSHVGLSDLINSSASVVCTDGSITSGKVCIDIGGYYSNIHAHALEPDLTAENIKSDVNIFGVTGTFTNDANIESDSENFSAEMLEGRTAYKKGKKITGTMPDGISTNGIQLRKKDNGKMEAFIDVIGEGYQRCIAPLASNELPTVGFAEFQEALDEMTSSTLPMTWNSYYYADGTPNAKVRTYSGMDIDKTSQFNNHPFFYVRGKTTKSGWVDEGKTLGIVLTENDLTENNIRSGKTILGITGTYTGADPFDFTYNITEGQTTDITCSNRVSSVLIEDDSVISEWHGAGDDYTVHITAKGTGRATRVVVKLMNNSFYCFRVQTYLKLQEL